VILLEFSGETSLIEEKIHLVATTSSILILVSIWLSQSFKLQAIGQGKLLQVSFSAEEAS
jgi:hypothetical protein